MRRSQQTSSGMDPGPLADPAKNKKTLRVQGPKNEGSGFVDGETIGVTMLGAKRSLFMDKGP